MKGDLISIIKILGVGFKEIVMDIDLTEFSINSIEIDIRDNIILHSFNSNIDVETPFDELSLEDQKIILKKLKSLLYN
jgi:hypothetical protein